VRLRRLGPPGRTIVLGALGLISAGVFSATVLVSLQAPEARATELAQRALVGHLALDEASFAAQESQTALLAAVATHDPGNRAVAIAAAQRHARLMGKAWATYRGHALGRPGERALQRVFDAAVARTEQSAAFAVGIPQSDPSFEAAVASEKADAERRDSVLRKLDTRFYEPVLLRDANAIVSGHASTRTALYIVLGLAGAAWSVVWLGLLRGARKDDALMREEATLMLAAAERADLETSLQHALDMETTEHGVSEVIDHALSIIAGEISTELLVADSTEAHFGQVVSTGADTDSACRVGAPAQCPAATTGRTQFFQNSGGLDTCPFLRGRDPAVWALCAPVSIAGSITGVIHAQRRADDRVPDRLAGSVELVARKVGDRIGVLRVLAGSEARAHVDALTGLPTRRTLEDNAHDLVARDASFVVAFADLDHFKAINDAHGHDVGDRALRLFARVLRDGVRPRDLPARYGGEEFVVVLPDCTLDDARIVAERIRTQLAAALESGRVPAFTVTIGLAAAQSGEGLSEVVSRADAAMIRAKTLGRDRVLVAVDSTPDFEPLGLVALGPKATP
jgi:diguanylate cyclase (GGDEF)-like protein